MKALLLTAALLLAATAAEARCSLQLYALHDPGHGFYGYVYTTCGLPATPVVRHNADLVRLGAPVALGPGRIFTPFDDVTRVLTAGDGLGVFSDTSNAGPYFTVRCGITGEYGDEVYVTSCFGQQSTP